MEPGSWKSASPCAACARVRPTPLLAVLTLALGVGGMAAIAGIVRPLLVNPLPYPRDNELAMFWANFSWQSREFASLRPNGQASRASPRIGPRCHRRNGNAPTRYVPGISSTTELFDVLGVKPRVGRGFQAGRGHAGCRTRRRAERRTVARARADPSSSAAAASSMASSER